MKPLFIINRASSRIRKKGSQLASLADSTDAMVIETDNLDKFIHNLSASLSQSPRHIFIEGGDGTAQMAMTEYFKRRNMDAGPARFTLISGGTTNQIAGNIGVKTINSDRLRALLNMETDTVHDLSLLDVRVDGGTANFGFLFSSGAIPMATNVFMGKVEQKGKKGPAAVYATILSALGKGADKSGSLMNPSPIKLRVNMKKEQAVIDEPHLGTITTTLPGFILGIDPFWGKGEAPLRSTYVSGRNPKIIRLVMQAALKQFSKLDATDGVESWNADHIHMEYAGPTVLDGEPMVPSEKSIEIRPSEPVTFVA